MVNVNSLHSMHIEKQPSLDISKENGFEKKKKVWK